VVAGGLALGVGHRPDKAMWTLPYAWMVIGYWVCEEELSLSKQGVVVQAKGGIAKLAD